MGLLLTTTFFGGMWLQVQSLVKNHPVSPGLNHPPIVTITTPENHSNFQPGQQVLYSIEVVDFEDGDSRYGEILPNEVFMEVWFFSSEQEMVNSESQTNSRVDTMGLQIIKESGCFNCHNSKTAFVGPPFYKIAKKYLQHDIDKLVSSVLEGSSENWTNAIMPAQVYLTEPEARQAVQWILANGGNDNSTIYPGINGFFPTRPEATNGVYVLKASYTDHGVEENQQSRLSGNDRVVVYAK